MPLPNIIIMVKRERTVRVNIPNRRTCRRATCDELPPNIRLRRPYRQRATPWNRRRPPLGTVQQQGKGLSSILKFSKRVIKNSLLKKIGRGALNELFNLYSKGTSKFKNKKLKKILQSEVANSLVELDNECGQHKLE